MNRMLAPLQMKKNMMGRHQLSMKPEKKYITNFIGKRI